jgi:hypothetical protein
VNYSEIKALAISYSDRADAEVADRMDDFLRIVEARINRPLKTQKMSTRVTINSITGQEYYGLPADFDGLRDIEIQDTDGNRTTPPYLSPELMNNKANTTTTEAGYTIIHDQLHIYPAQTGAVIELVYYQTLLPLTSEVTTNWVGDLYPDCYVFGLLVEINAFVKDPQTATVWDARFKEAIAEIDSNDQLSRWSGTALQVRIAT